MKMSILPIYVIAVFAFCVFITHRAKRVQSINTAEARSVYMLLPATVKLMKRTMKNATTAMMSMTTIAVMSVSLSQAMAGAV